MAQVHRQPSSNYLFVCLFWSMATLVSVNLIANQINADVLIVPPEQQQQLQQTQRHNQNYNKNSNNNRTNSDILLLDNAGQSAFDSASNGISVSKEQHFVVLHLLVRDQTQIDRATSPRASHSQQFIFIAHSKLTLLTYQTKIFPSLLPLSTIVIYCRHHLSI